MQREGLRTEVVTRVRTSSARSGVIASGLEPTTGEIELMFSAVGTVVSAPIVERRRAHHRWCRRGSGCAVTRRRATRRRRARRRDRPPRQPRRTSGDCTRTRRSRRCHIPFRDEHRRGRESLSALRDHWASSARSTSILAARLAGNTAATAPAKAAMRVTTARLVTGTVRVSIP